jgi:hypothetical protein
MDHGRLTKRGDQQDLAPLKFGSKGNLQAFFYYNVNIKRIASS